MFAGDAAMFGVYKCLEIFYKYAQQLISKLNKRIHIVTNDINACIALKSPHPSIESYFLQNEIESIKQIGFSISFHFIHSSQWNGVSLFKILNLIQKKTQQTTCTKFVQLKLCTNT